MSNRAKGLLLACISALLYGTIPVLAKIIVADFPPLLVAFIITVIGDCYFAAIAAARGELIRNFSHRHFRWIVFIGFLAALGSFFSFTGIKLGTASEAGFLFQLETSFAAILAYVFLKEKLSKQQIRGLLVMFLGGYLFAVGFSQPNIGAGSLFLLAAAFVWGAIVTTVRRRTRDFSPFFIAFGRSFFSAIFLSPFVIWYIPQYIGKVSVVHVLYFLLYGSIVAGILISLYTALRYIKAAEATAFQTLVPIITTVIAFFTLGERLEQPQLIGGLIILLGLFLVTRRPHTLSEP